MSGVLDGLYAQGLPQMPMAKKKPLWDYSNSSIEGDQSGIYGRAGMMLNPQGPLSVGYSRGFEMSPEGMMAGDNYSRPMMTDEEIKAILRLRGGLGIEASGTFGGDEGRGYNLSIKKQF